jgi:hypothetical protein
MGVGVDIDTHGQPWTVTYNGTTGTALPALLCSCDLIPLRFRWVPVTAGDTVIIEDGQGRTVYEEVASGTNPDPVEQRPNGKEVYIGTGAGIRIKTFASGVLLIYV